MSGRTLRTVVTASLVLLLASGCGSDGPPATLHVDIGEDTPVVVSAAGFMEGCYRDGAAPETCTSGTDPDLYAFCADLVGSADLQAADVIGAVTVYPADNDRIGDVSCLFSNPRSSLAIELWREPPATLCPAGGAVGPCIDAGAGLEAGRSSDLPMISVSGLGGRVVSIVSSPTLDDPQLVAAAAVLASEVFDQPVTPEALAGLQSSTKPE